MSAAKTFTLTRPDGMNLFVRDWPTANPATARGSVLIVHGLGEHSGRYEALARWLNERGLWVRAPDLRGHGQSGGARGVIRRDDDHLQDIAAMIEALQAASGQVPFLLGHSMGGLIATAIAVRRMLPLRGLVASSPALDAGLSLPQRLLVGAMLRLAPHKAVRNGLAVDAISHDIHVVSAYKNDRLVHDRICARLAHFIHTEGVNARVQAGLLNVPALLLYAEADRLVNPAGSREFAATAPAAWLTAKGYDGAYHELFNEVPQYRDAVLADLDAWLERQLTRNPTE
jgi:alpha-beta hydrolase superfamily lysophospholipase